MRRTCRPARRWRSWIPPALVAAGCLASGSGQPSVPPGLGPFPAISRPSDYRELAVAIRGRVDRVHVAPGDTVEPGDELLTLEDSVQRQTIELARLSAGDDSSVRNSQLLRDHWAEEVRLTSESNQQGGASENELRDARLKLGQSEISLDSAKIMLREAGVELARELARLDEMRVVSPIAGTILDVHKRQGEAADEQTKVITVISTNPLWLEVNVPTKDAMRLRVGDAASIRWQDLEDAIDMDGKIIFVSPAGHAGARQIQVRVEVSNDSGLPSGLHSDIWFHPAPRAAAGS